MSALIKICGMRESDNIKAVAELKPDFMGFIFYPGSPRFAGDILKPEILSSLPWDIRKTGVFVNKEFNDIISDVVKYSLNVATSIRPIVLAVLAGLTVWLSMLEVEVLFKVSPA